MDASSGVWRRDKARWPLVMTMMTTLLLLLLVTTSAIRAAPTTTTTTTTTTQAQQLQQSQLQQPNNHHHHLLFQQLFNITGDNDCSPRDCDESVNREHLATLQRYMNLDADPCEDFHEFACSNWKREHENETTTMKLGDRRLNQRYLELFERWVRQEMEDEVKKEDEENETKKKEYEDMMKKDNEEMEKKERLQRHLQQDDDDDDVPPPDDVSPPDDLHYPSRRSLTALDSVQRKVFEYYKVCRSLADGGKKLSLSGYVEQMRQTTTLWTKQPFSQFDWLQTLADLGRYGYSEHFVKIKMSTFNATDHRLALLPQDVYTTLNINTTRRSEKKNEEDDKTEVDEIFEILGEYTTKDRRRIESDLRDFEADLKKVIERAQQTKDDDNKNDGDADRNKNDRRDYDKSNDGKNDDNNNEDDDYDDDPEFLELSLEQLSAKIDDGSGGHLDWQMFLSRILDRRVDAADTILIERLPTIRAIVRFLQQTDREILFLYTLARYLQYLSDQKAPNFLHTPATRFDCVRHMRQNLHLPMSYVYEREFYAKDRRRSDAIIHRIFDSLRQEFNVILHENAMGFGADEILYLRQKIDRMRLNIGNLPTTNIDDDFYRDYVRNLNITENFYHNHLNALQHFYGHLYFLATLKDHDLNSQMHSFHLSTPDLDDLIDMSPFFYCLGNIIIIPYAYLQLPFYSPDLRDTLLYGDLANMLGHELMHGYESSFLLYDANGAKNLTAYHAISSNRNFRENFACLKEGTQHPSERIADVSGTHLSIRAFLRDPVRRARTGRLFFLQFAQFFCGSTDPEIFQEEDPFHDMDNVRLNYVLSQMPEFAEVFECPRGSAMRPEQICHMW